MVLMSVYAEWNELFMTSAQRYSAGEYVHGITEALKMDTQDGAKAGYQWPVADSLKECKLGSWAKLALGVRKKKQSIHQP